MLEVDKLYEVCQSFEYDTRFKELGPVTITEHDLQEENGVLDILHGESWGTPTLPFKLQFIDFDDKHDIEFGLWTRTTIPWTLSCPPRQMASDKL